MKFKVAVAGLDEARYKAITSIVEDLAFKTFDKNEESLISQFEKIDSANEGSISKSRIDYSDIFDIAHYEMIEDFDEQLNRMYHHLIDNFQDEILSNDFTDSLIDELNSTYDDVVAPVNEFEFKTTSDKITMEEIKDFANKLFINKFTYRPVDAIQFDNYRSFSYKNYQIYYKCDFEYALELLTEQILERIKVDLVVSDEI